jgi:hypothetical protein
MFWVFHLISSWKIDGKQTTFFTEDSAENFEFSNQWLPQDSGVSNVFTRLIKTLWLCDVMCHVTSVWNTRDQSHRALGGLQGRIEHFLTRGFIGPQKAKYFPRYKFCENWIVNSSVMNTDIASKFGGVKCLYWRDWSRPLAVWCNVSYDFSLNSHMGFSNCCEWTWR